MKSHYYRIQRNDPDAGWRGSAYYSSRSGARRAKGLLEQYFGLKQVRILKVTEEVVR